MSGMDGDVTWALISVAAGLAGAGLGAWVTWRATNKATDDQARQASFERLDEAVQNLATASAAAARELDNMRAADLERVNDLATIVMSRARSLSPRLAVCMGILIVEVRAALGPPSHLRVKPSEDVRGSDLRFEIVGRSAWRKFAVPMWAMNDLCTDWMSGWEAFEGAVGADFGAYPYLERAAARYDDAE